MKPINLETRIFLDSGDSGDTEIAFQKLGFLDGQTTNPSYFAKSSKVKEYLEKKGKFSKEELKNAYKETVQKISSRIPDGSVSIEVYADANTTAEEMIIEAREMFSWIPNAHIKLPIIHEGLKAAQMAVGEGMRVNMTLCFTQEQAAAVYSATKGAIKGGVFISPFVGRYTDKGINGIDLIKNIIKMYSIGDEHVEVLTASLRSIQEFYVAIQLGTDAITAGMKYLDEWVIEGMKVPGEDFVYNPENLKPIFYEEFDLDKSWEEFNIKSEMTDAGLDMFLKDWNNLIK